jgi:hypothetical protein
LPLDEKTLMRQFRAWETIATLDLRVARSSGTARADLLYKEAAVHYHDPRVLFPAYGDIFGFRTIFRHIARSEYHEGPGDFGAFVRTSYPLLRAIALFDRIEREHPRYPALDKVLYSKGLAWAKLGDYQCDAVEGAYGTEDKRPWATKIRNAVESFERCAALCPRSTLADDALRAAAYWREERSRAFE